MSPSEYPNDFLCFPVTSAENLHTTLRLYWSFAVIDLSGASLQLGGISSHRWKFERTLAPPAPVARTRTACFRLGYC